MQTELHRHLDVSIRSSTLLRLAQERGLEGQSTSLASFREKHILSSPLRDLSSVLANFTLYQRVLDRPEVLEQVAFETLEDCWNEGTQKVELRYAPGFVSEYSHLDWLEALQAFQRGIEQGLATYPKMQAGLICIAVRDFGVDGADEAIEFFLKNESQFLGLDLAGNEVHAPCRLFQSSFKKVIARESNITIHAGEASGPENIWEAIELLGAQRIGHGIACVKDPVLMEYLKKNQICLEMCPTSNWLTQGVSSIAEHPLPQVLRAGIPVCINTDDPGIFGVTLPHEFKICQEIMGLSEFEIEKCNDYASKASFLST